MLATDVLREEHEVIERALAILEMSVRRIERGGEAPSETLKKALDFVRTFADRCHHAKEEDCLFPALEDRGLPRDAGPIAVMLLEHEEGRTLVRAAAEALDQCESGDATAAGSLAQNLRGYTELLRDHILKENTVLFPMADRLLSTDDQNDLLDQFGRVEKEKVGEGVRERYEKLLEAIAAEVGVPD